MKAEFRALALAAALILPGAVLAQSIGGNASIAVTGTTGNVQLPEPTNGPSGFPALLLEYGVGGASEEIFYQLGATDAVAAVVPSLPATPGSPALPANGICINPGPNIWVAAITATSTATLRMTQLSVCPPR